jgi:hypothetical protein
MPRSGDGIVNNLGEALYCGDFASCALVMPLFIHGGVVKPLFSLAYGVATPSSTVVPVTYGRPHGRIFDVGSNRETKRETTNRMIQLCSLLMMFMYIYNGKGCIQETRLLAKGWIERSNRRRLPNWQPHTHVGMRGFP